MYSFLGSNRETRPLGNSIPKAINFILGQFSRFNKRNDHAFIKVNVETRFFGKQGEDSIDFRESVTDVTYDNPYVVSEGTKALIFLAVDDGLKFPKYNINANSEENHREGAALPDTRKNIRAKKRFSCDLNEMKAVAVEFPNPRYKSVVKAKERKTFQRYS